MRAVRPDIAEWSTTDELLAALIESVSATRIKRPSAPHRSEPTAAAAPDDSWKSSWRQFESVTYVPPEEG